MLKKIVNTFRIFFNLKNIKENMETFNKMTYNAPDMSRFYSSEEHLNRLFKPEETILNILKDRFKDMKMLDIGVGGGRTTHYFAHLVKEYVGVDYSESMIKACRERFKDIHFEVCDVRSLDIFEDNAFDFVLFSASGIDSVPYEERLKALKEIKRVCKNDGFFCFASHNLLNVDKLMALKFSKNPIEMLRNIRRYILFRAANKSPEELKKEKYTVINAYETRHKTYYAKPEEHIRQLEGVGFKNIRTFGREDGKEISNTELGTVTDNWIYFLCEA